MYHFHLKDDIMAILWRVLVCTYASRSGRTRPAASALSLTCDGRSVARRVTPLRVVPDAARRGRAEPKLYLAREWARRGAWPLHLPIRRPRTRMRRRRCRQRSRERRSEVLRCAAIARRCVPCDGLSRSRCACAQAWRARLRAPRRRSRLRGCRSGARAPRRTTRPLRPVRAP